MSTPRTLAPSWSENSPMGSSFSGRNVKPRRAAAVGQRSPEQMRWNEGEIIERNVSYLSAKGTAASRIYLPYLLTFQTVSPTCVEIWLAL